jgi:hypothetical protein
MSSANIKTVGYELPEIQSGPSGTNTASCRYLSQLQPVHWVFLALLLGMW